MKTNDLHSINCSRAKAAPDFAMTNLGTFRKNQRNLMETAIGVVVGLFAFPTAIKNRKANLASCSAGGICLNP
jgi:hypothetical protein